jgi:hypothetical protein
VRDPIEVIEAGGKLRNGLFLRRINLYEDRIAFDVYASRAFRADELAALRLTDDVGTEYEMVSPNEVVEGEVLITFEPAPPAGVNFHLSEPGWGLHSFDLKDRGIL